MHESSWTEAMKITTARASAIVIFWLIARRKYIGAYLARWRETGDLYWWIGRRTQRKYVRIYED